MRAFELIHLTKAFNRLLDAINILKNATVLDPHEPIVDAYRVIKEVSDNLEEAGLQYNRENKVGVQIDD